MKGMSVKEWLYWLGESIKSESKLLTIIDPSPELDESHSATRQALQAQEEIDRANACDRAIQRRYPQ